MTLAYATKLDLTIWKICVKVQKIDGLSLETYGIVSASFSLQNSLKRVWFFEKTLLLANIIIELILEIFFLSLSNVDVKFIELENLT